MSKRIMIVNVPFRPPDVQHRKWDNGHLVFDNQQGENKRVKIPVIEVVKSDTWYPDQLVSGLYGYVARMDIFEYGQYYVILKQDGSKIQVLNDGGINWHIAKQGE